MVSSSTLHSRRALWLLGSPKHGAGSAPHDPEGGQGPTYLKLGQMPTCQMLPDNKRGLIHLSAEACDLKCLQAVGCHEGSISTNLGSFIFPPYRQLEDPEKPVRERQRLREPDTFRASRSAEGHTDRTVWRWLQKQEQGTRAVGDGGFTPARHGVRAWGRQELERKTERGILGNLRVRNFSLKKEKSLFQSTEVLEEERKRT